jgi:hypothetical protein
VPAELEWLANLTNRKTCRAYKIDVEKFIVFAEVVSNVSVRRW